VSNTKLVVAGHSQGAKVALAIALKNKNVTHLGLFGANPLGRIDQYIREARKEAEAKKISWEEANKKMEDNYDFYKMINNKDSLKAYPELVAWQSFSKPQLNDYLKSKIPFYLAYGSEDITSDLCDIVPLSFIEHNKTNLTYKRYLNLEHNFFEISEDGQPNYDKGHWTEVMNEFVKWTLR
jgi:pimeloyl-ACP methyl ester carboxylesterase